MARFLRWSVGLIVAAGILFPAAALAFYKPTRVLVPEFFGVECYAEGVCLDDRNRLAEALGLRREAIEFVTALFGAPQTVPQMIFCSAEPCARSFGMYHAAAYNVGTVGIVIRTRGWEPHYVRHELIHHVQNERLGSATMFLLRPVWWREGMAYELSGDPREPIPSVVLECWRAKFRAWYAGIDPERIWDAPVPDEMPDNVSRHCKA